MKSREVLRVLAEVSESQWGMVTSAQAGVRGVSHMNLTRLTESGGLVRLSQGVYKDAGAPSDKHQDLRAAWLATDPIKLAYQRLSERPGNAVVSGESAAKLHGIGDFRAAKSEFTTPNRKQTQRPDICYRTSVLDKQDVTVRDGLPVTTYERTIADLVKDRQDLSIVGNALRDAARQSHLDVERLTTLLSPLALRNGYRKGDGYALYQKLLQLGGVDIESLAKQLAAIPNLGALITAYYLNSLPNLNSQFGAVFEVLKEQSAINTAVKPTETVSQLVEQLNVIDWLEILRSTQMKNDSED